MICSLNYNAKLHLDQGNFLQDPSLYRRLVGKLNFLTQTRANITFFVQHLSKFLQSLGEPHLQVALHFLQYLKGEPA